MQKGLTSLNELLVGDRIFRVPLFQRNYAWQEDQLEDFWEDIFFLEPDKKHYFGTVILRQAPDQRKSMLKIFDIYDIIDGQQRISTAMILLREILSRLEQVGGAEVAEQLGDLKKGYLKYDSIYKLEMLGDDRQFFENFIVDGRTFPDEITTPSQQRLRDARSFFQRKLDDAQGSRPKNDFLSLCIALKNRVDQLELMTYPVENEEEAVLIFETVNDRGKPLSNLEKTKSFLMHMMYVSNPKDQDLSTDLRKMEETFGNVFRYFEGIASSPWNLDLKEDDIQRYHFIAFEPTAAGERKHASRYLDYLKETLRSKYQSNRSDCVSYISSYSGDLEKVFFALRELANRTEADEVQSALERLFTLGHVANFYPLLIATWEPLRKHIAELANILGLLETFAMRVYVVGGRRGDTGLHQLYSLANKVHNGLTSTRDIPSALKTLVLDYEKDADFSRDLGAGDFYDRMESRDMKYLLFRYETFLRNSAREPLDLKLGAVMSPEFEIEHIWAQNPAQLPEDQEEEHAESKDALGNLTLAAKAWNASWGNKPFAEKKTADWGYQRSILRVQKELADWNAVEWRAPEIKERSKSLAGFCLREWSIA